MTTQPTPEPVVLDAREAVAYSKMSLSTLKRRAQQGHPVGLRRHGRRLVFVLEELRRFLTQAEDDAGRSHLNSCKTD